MYCNICHQKKHGHLELCPEWHNDEGMENYNGNTDKQREKQDDRGKTRQ